MLQADRDAGINSSSVSTRMQVNARRFQDRLRRLTHGHLPGVPVAVIAAHADNGQEKETGHSGAKRKIYTIRRRRSTAPAARCAHAEMRPALQRDAFFPRRDRDGMDVRVGNRTVDQLAVPRIGTYENWVTSNSFLSRS